jgi:hypothetical protein
MFDMRSDPKTVMWFVFSIIALMVRESLQCPGALSPIRLLQRCLWDLVQSSNSIARSSQLALISGIIHSQFGAYIWKASESICTPVYRLGVFDAEYQVR